MPAMDLKTYKRAPQSGEKAKSIVFLLHGLGANGMDLLGLADYWQQVLPDTVFVSPDAPFPCDMAPVGYQWFSLQDRSPQSMLAGIQNADPILQDYISKTLKEYDLTEDKAVLVGFSQGTMMSLYTAPRRGAKFAGVLGYSGALLGEAELSGSNVQKMPICLIHGDSDDIVPVMAYHHAKQVLENNGFMVNGGIHRNLMHGIDEAGIREGADFLRSILK
jgi:phospholipase/carboxylesterase